MLLQIIYHTAKCLSTKKTQLLIQCLRGLISKVNKKIFVCFSVFWNNLTPNAIYFKIYIAINNTKTIPRYFAPIVNKEPKELCSFRQSGVTRKSKAVFLCFAYCPINIIEPKNNTAFTQCCLFIIFCVLFVRLSNHP